MIQICWNREHSMIGIGLILTFHVPSKFAAPSHIRLALFLSYQRKYQRLKFKWWWCVSSCKRNDAWVHILIQSICYMWGLSLQYLMLWYKYNFMWIKKIKINSRFLSHQKKDQPILLKESPIFSTSNICDNDLNIKLERKSFALLWGDKSWGKYEIFSWVGFFLGSPQVMRGVKRCTCT